MRLATRLGGDARGFVRAPPPSPPRSAPPPAPPPPPPPSSPAPRAGASPPSRARAPPREEPRTPRRGSPAGSGRGRRPPRAPTRAIATHAYRVARRRVAGGSRRPRARVPRLAPILFQIGGVPPESALGASVLQRRRRRPPAAEPEPSLVAVCGSSLGHPPGLGPDALLISPSAHAPAPPLPNSARRFADSAAALRHSATTPWKHRRSASSAHAAVGSPARGTVRRISSASAHARSDASRFRLSLSSRASCRSSLPLYHARSSPPKKSGAVRERASASASADSDPSSDAFLMSESTSAAATAAPSGVDANRRRVMRESAARCAGARPAHVRANAATWARESGGDPAAPRKSPQHARNSAHACVARLSVPRSAAKERSSACAALRPASGPPFRRRRWRSCGESPRPRLLGSSAPPRDAATTKLEQRRQPTLERKQHVRRRRAREAGAGGAVDQAGPAERVPEPPRRRGGRGRHAALRERLADRRRGRARGRAGSEKSGRLLRPDAPQGRRERAVPRRRQRPRGVRERGGVHAAVHDPGLDDRAAHVEPALGASSPVDPGASAPSPSPSPRRFSARPSAAGPPAPAAPSPPRKPRTRPPPPPRRRRSHRPHRRRRRAPRPSTPTRAPGTSSPPRSGRNTRRTARRVRARPSPGARTAGRRAAPSRANTHPRW